MRTRKETVRVIRVHDHGPNTPACKFHVFAIDPLPFVAGVQRLVNAAVSLKRTCDQYLVGVVRIDQNTCEITKRKIAAPAMPRRACIAADIKCLGRAHLDVVRPLRVGRDRADRDAVGRSARFLPGLAVVTRH